MNPSEDQSPYQVLARKYRPQSFDQMIGQDTLVRVMRNAFSSGRVAHAFILTGVRGVGKTTAARILAKCLNCTGLDDSGAPTFAPCGRCANCNSISNGHNVDVLEMDAASRTGVADIRDIIESVAYQAVDSRFRVYIIDEVHMLSNSAFNALLKTLEEPPSHAKFVFATTEIHQVPATILSRCQRFDLRRIRPEVMSGHLQRIARLEGARISDNAIALIVRAAEGSARDALSLLDQAISFTGGNIEASPIRKMLALADKGRILDLFELMMEGRAKEAISELDAQYREGAEPLSLLQELADIANLLSVAKISPRTLDNPTLSPDERTRSLHLSKNLDLQVLARAWQMLLKSIEEISYSPSALMVAQMAIIRLTHVAALPVPGDLVRHLTSSSPISRSRDSEVVHKELKPPADREAPETESTGAQPQFGSAQTEPLQTTSDNECGNGSEAKSVPDTTVQADEVVGGAAPIQPEPDPVGSDEHVEPADQLSIDIETAKAHPLSMAVLKEFPNAVAKLQSDQG